jgi:hypothetical protein
LFAFRFFLRSWLRADVGHESTRQLPSWPSKVAHILSVQDNPSEDSEGATIYLEISKFEACNLSKWYINQFVSQETHQISITKPNRLNIFILGIVRNINSAREKRFP